MATLRWTPAKRKRRPKATTKKPAKPAATARARKRATAAKPPARRTKTKPARAVRSCRVAAALPPPLPAGGAMLRAAVLPAKVEAALRAHGYVPPDRVAVEVLTAVAARYRRGPAAPPAGLPIAVDADGPDAEAVVERFAAGDRARDVDRSTHRGQVRAAVHIEFDQRPRGDAERRPDLALPRLVESEQSSERRALRDRERGGRLVPLGPRLR